MLVVNFYVSFGRDTGMSKIGRKPIHIGSLTVEIRDSEIQYKGKKGSGVYVLPAQLQADLVNKHIKLSARETSDRNINRVWGLHRALLANALKGAETDFQKQLKITGLGFKAVVTNNRVQFSLGFSHKIDVELPQNVTLEVDKTGQLLTFKSPNKTVLGLICSKVRALRPPEPYKGTGITYTTETIMRKAGKAKSA